MGSAADNVALGQNILVCLLPIIISPMLSSHVQHHHPYHQAVVQEAHLRLPPTSIKDIS
jgi:hypothetical protein